ncbi:MAG: class I SAM-dependent rRNA methyltransferase [Planctomycetes bacterium]|nr:class I SAM-dependent rRNA methyltransferase [Planctomycetota bacterium]
MAAEFLLHGKGRRRGQSRHPWVFRDQVEAGAASAGAIVRVVDEARRQLGWAAYSPQSKIALRFIVFGAAAECPTAASLKAAFLAALERRRALRERSDALRLVSSEADGLPGLIADQYGEAVVLQALTPFAEALLPDVVAWLEEALQPRSILARNDAAVRRLEGLPLEVKHLAGAVLPEVEIREGGLRFTVDLLQGQKTGMFLDQRANRLRFGEVVRAGDRVLDAFAYSGGFALHAAARASAVLALDDSQRAVDLAGRNVALNGLCNVTLEKGNSFQRLRALIRDKEMFDAVVLDPPAFAKTQSELEGALRGYREINVRALRLLRPGGLLATSSCSYQMPEPLFEEVLRGAASDVGRDVLVIERRGQDADHPVLLSLPESRYLKCFFLRVG